MKLLNHLHWGSHMPVLMRLMEMTEGDVLELGTGVYSTPFLHYACSLQGRHLVSYENDKKYFDIYKGYQSKFHDIIFVENWNNIKIRRRWGIVFIDVIPDIVRKDLALKVAKCAKYIVLHDSNPYNDRSTHYSEIYPSFKYRYDYKKQDPNTTILSNFKRIKL